MISIGELIDKLTVVNLKIWHLEDIKRDDNATDKKIADATKKTNILNVQRNQLIEQIDKILSEAIDGKSELQKSFAGTTKIYGKLES